MLSSADGAKDMRGAAYGVVTGGIVGGVLATAAAFLIPPIGIAIAGGVIASMLGGVAAKGRRSAEFLGSAARPWSTASVK